MDEQKKSGLIEEACRAYGIQKNFVFASSEKDGMATIVTVGGFKVRYKAGDKPDPLPEYRVTGKGQPPPEKKKEKK